MNHGYLYWLTAACLACAAPQSRQPQPPATAVAAPPAPKTSKPPLVDTAPAIPSAPAAGLPSLSTFFEARGGDGAKRPLVSGDSLRSGDHFWVELVAREKLFVWVLYASPDGSAQVIYPTSGEVALTPGRTQRVPETQDFELDHSVGWERLLIVASRERLSGSTSQLAKLVEQVRATHRWPSEEPAAPEREPEKKPASAAKPARASRSAASSGNAYGGPTPILEPRLASADTRGLTRGIKLVDSQAGRLDFEPDAEGVIAIPLLLKHEP